MFVKHYAPNSLPLPVNSHHVLFKRLPKFSKSHNSEKIKWFFKKIQSSNLFIIPYHLTKFQAPSSNAFKMPKFLKGHNSRKIRWFFFLIYSNLLIIPYQLTKFQAPSSNSFRDILLKIFKCPNFQILVEIFCWKDFIPIFSKSRKIRWFFF